MGNYLCRKRSINDSGRRTDISGRCGREFITLAESTTCWGGGFPADLKFYWLHFEVKAPDSDPRWLTHLSVPQQTKVVDPQALVALFRQFLSEQEKHQRTPALEFIVLLILQQLTRDARLDEQADGAGTTLAWKAQKLIRTQYHRPLSTALLARELYCNADYLGRVYRRVFHLTLT
ncbi:araC family regulatory helix-turn-helix domain-containing protein [Escherichia coli P0299917.2]|nr:araC family regulatory helix-turn-helix domain-containing protein [Escherichia coli P0299917.2]